MDHHPILVPVDGSQRAEAALPYAVALAEAAGVGISLLAVVEDLGVSASADRLEALVGEGLRSYLHGLAEHLRAGGTLVEVAVRQGDPAATILAQAQHAPAVVMTTRGLGGLDRWRLGSVADKVMRLAPCPVVLIRPAEDSPPRDEPWWPRQILVPLDGSPPAEEALPTAYDWAAALGCAVVLVRVQPWLSTQMAIDERYIPDAGRFEEEAAQAAAEYLAYLQQRAPAGLTVTSEVLRGDPAACLIEFAETQPVDLVVMSSHGRGGVGRMALGSVTDRIVRHGLPTCIVPAAALRSANDQEEREGATPP
jgi:nucleotide-binding universal stress UspA family protein